MNHFRLGSHMRLLLLQKAFATFKDKKILDVGCNYGEITKALVPNNRVVGIDTDEKALKVAKKTIKKARFVKASATNLPFPDKSFDVITCLSVLEHIRDDQKALNEISRVLKDDAQLILTIPNENARYIPRGIEYLVRSINCLFKTNYPESDEEYVHFGQEGIGHIHWGYSIKKIKKMLSEADLKMTFYKTYWHAPTRFAYFLLISPIKKGLIKEGLAKAIFLPFFFLDKIFKDDKGDILIFAKKINRNEA